MSVAPTFETPSARVCFRVEGKPPVKRRPRFANGRAYSPTANKRDEQRVYEAFCDASMATYGHIVRAPEGTPVALSVITRRGLPRTTPRKVTSEEDTGHSYDLDNVVKSVSDALQGDGRPIPDDCAVTRIIAEKAPRLRDAEDVTIVAVSWGDELTYLRDTYTHWEGGLAADLRPKE